MEKHLEASIGHNPIVSKELWLEARKALLRKTGWVIAAKSRSLAV
jgi:hypothetical protein